MLEAGRTPLVVGLSGGCSPSRRVPDDRREDWWTPSDAEVLHDAAAVLVRDGRIVAAIEEERLNRLKHTNKLARHAIGACLAVAGVQADAITRIAYYGVEGDLDADLATYVLRRPHVRAVSSVREYLARALSHDLDAAIAPERIEFVEHHVAHAASAYYPGPFADALVVTLDGFGDRLSGTVWAAAEGRLERLLDIPKRQSLGLLYLEAIRYLGYSLFDEYKVMGLAPYGDPSRFRHVFEPMCELKPDGRYDVHLERVTRLREILPVPRRSGEPLSTVHRDVAAALQETLEGAAAHLLTHYRRATGLRHLCLAGGVAHNSTMIGAIARSGLFDGVFVQPASHDGGCALGAALHVYRALEPHCPLVPVQDVYWGRPLPDAAATGRRLGAWSDLVHVTRSSDIAAETAALIARGAIVGWVQGRSEFGPRALGNRSILADPRPAAAKDRINEAVKQREAYRPFAPAVLEEYADAWFEMPSGTCGAFMTFTVLVRASVRDVLGAVTHVDGTARVQTVSKSTNARFWALIDAFRIQTGVPVLLNTSFNHSVEPIVDSIDDALTCFLTTGLTHLVIDEYLVTRRQTIGERVWSLVPHLPEHVRIVYARELDSAGRPRDVYRCERTASPVTGRPLTAAAYRLLSEADGTRRCGELRPDTLNAAAASTLADELETLWSARLLRLLPGDRSAVADARCAALADTVAVSP